MTGQPALRGAPAAQEARRALSEAIDEIDGQVPCRSDALFLSPDDWAIDGPMNQDAAVQCRPCPVREQCALYALLAGEPQGVWGGITAARRRSQRRSEQRNKPASQFA